MSAERIGNIIYNIYDRYTGSPFNATVITEWADGSPMDDTKVDNAIYFKNKAGLGGGYIKRNYENGVNVKWFGAKGDGINDDTSAIQKCLDVVESMGGGTIDIPETGSTYNLSDTIAIGSYTILNFKGSYVKLTTYTTIGTVIFNKPGATGIVINNPLIDGNEIIAGGSGQNGISFGNGGTCIVNGGDIINCFRGDVEPKDGGKAFQVESYSVESFIANGTTVKNCHKVISSHRDFTHAGSIKAVFNNISAVDCDQLAIVSQTNGTDLTGIEQAIEINNFISYDCGTVDGLIIVSRTNNLKVSGTVIGSVSIPSVIRGRHNKCSFDLNVFAPCSAVIDINPSSYGIDQGVTQLNNYKLNVYNTYDYLTKSDTTGVTYPNRTIDASFIEAFVNLDATLSLIELNSRSASTVTVINSSVGKFFKGSSFRLTAYGNKISTLPTGSSMPDTTMDILTAKEASTFEKGLTIKQLSSILQLKLERTGTNVGSSYIGVNDIYSMILSHPTTIASLLRVDYSGNLITNNLKYGLGAPEAAITAIPGTIWADQSATNGIVLYLKSTGSAATGWRPIQSAHSGTTANRPALTSVQAGYSYFDTTLGRSVVWSGTVWTDFVEKIGTGWATYTDNVYTVGAPFSIATGVTSTLPNNAATILNSQIPIGVTDLYNPSTGKITPQSDGDYYIFAIRFKAKTTAANGGYLDFGIDIGGAMGIILTETKPFLKGAATEQKFSITCGAFTAATFLANGGLVKITAGNGDMQVYDIEFQISRTHKAR